MPNYRGIYLLNISSSHPTKVGFLFLDGCGVGELEKEFYKQKSKHHYKLIMLTLASDEADLVLWRDNNYEISDYPELSGNILKTIKFKKPKLNAGY